MRAIAKIGVKQSLGIPSSAFFAVVLTDGFLDHQRGLEMVAGAVSGELLRIALENLRPRIDRLVNAVAEAGNLVFSGDHFLNRTARFVGGADSIEKGHDIFVGAAVKRAGQGAERRARYAVGVGHG